MGIGGNLLRVLHLVSFDRWTGAAAVALAEVEALRQAGFEASFAFTRGHNLERRLSGQPWAAPLLSKLQNPWTLATNAAAVARFAEIHDIAIIHCHLTWDHSIGRIAAGRTRALVRTFHSAPHPRLDPWTRILLSGTHAVAAVSSVIADQHDLASHHPVVTSPPLDPAWFTPNGPSAREIHAIDPATPVFGVIGKMAPGRGFEEALVAFRAISAARPAARLLIVGHGPHRPVLERLAASLGITDQVIWAGYREPDLASHFRAMDVMLFAAAGSDHGHRAITEALGCGTPVACLPVPGVEEALDALAGRCVAREGTPDALARIALDLLDSRTEDLLRACPEAAAVRSFSESAKRLESLYARAIAVRQG